MLTMIGFSVVATIQMLVRSGVGLFTCGKSREDLRASLLQRSGNHSHHSLSSCSLRASQH